MAYFVYISCLLTTILIEIAVASVLLAATTPRPVAPIIAAASSVNLLSHPLAWLSYELFPECFFLVELAVVLLEWLLWVPLLRLSWHSAAMLSIAANTLTLGAGFLL